MCYTKTCCAPIGRASRLNQSERNRFTTDSKSRAPACNRFSNGAQLALWAEMHCQLTKIRVLNYMRLEPLSESTNERQELASLIG